MFKCPLNTVFDGSPGVSSCVYRCPRVGRFQYKLDARADNSFYYECENIGGRIVGTLKNCEQGEEFVIATENCEPTY
jgi:hypothetical protein